MRSRSFSRRAIRIQARAVGEVNVQPAIVVVVEKCQAAAFGFDDVALVISAAPHVGDGQAGFFGDVYELTGREM